MVYKNITNIVGRFKFANQDACVNTGVSVLKVQRIQAKVQRECRIEPQAVFLTATKHRTTNAKGI